MVFEIILMDYTFYNYTNYTPMENGSLIQANYSWSKYIGIRYRYIRYRFEIRLIIITHGTW